MNEIRVGFDAHALGQQQTGNETYVLGLLHGLSQIGFPVHAYGSSAPPNGHAQRQLGSTSRWRRLALDVPLAAARDRLDLYHGVWAIPPLSPCRTVVTIHDLTFVVHPAWLGRRQSAILRRVVGHSIRRAAHVIVISECTKRDIVDHYSTPEERITVTHLAPRPAFLIPSDPADHTDEYFLYVGTIVPRKNVLLLIRALALLRDRGAAVPLVLAGRPGVAYQEIHELIHRLDLEGLVRCTGYVSDEQLRTLYAECSAVVHPSLYEGFGLTPLEAMAQGKPVLAADAGALPEVVGKAGILLPPDDPEAWANAMEHVLCPIINADLARRGRLRAAQFSWERCALETVGVYRAALLGD